MMLSMIGLLLLSAFAAAPPAGPDGVKPPAPPTPGEGSAAISNALCGRSNPQRSRAEALDSFDESSLPGSWGKATVEELDGWAEAPPCAEATAAETKQFEARRRVLTELRNYVEKLRAIGRLEVELLQLRLPTVRSEDWPPSGQCTECAALRRAAITLQAIQANLLPRPGKGEGATLKALLVSAHRREELLGQLCSVAPPARTRAELERRFRYFSWTPSGNQLIAVAEFFARPEVAGVCAAR